MKCRAYLIALVCSVVHFVHAETVETTNTLARGLADLRFNLTRIEVESTNKVADLIDLAQQAETWVTRYPGKPEPLIWKGIILSARAKYVGISALKLVDEARGLLEKAVDLDPNACDGAGLNALGMLYYKAPSWPISFGNNKKARAYFERALASSSNLDTHFRTGEFLIHIGKTEEGLAHLRAALATPERGRPEDVWKRNEIAALIQKYAGAQ